MAGHTWRRTVQWAFIVAVLALIVGAGTRFSWWRSFADPSKGAWPWVEVASWVVGIGLGVPAISAFFLGRRKKEPPRLDARPEGRGEAGRDPTLLDRRGEYKRLAERLRNGPWGVVSVVGSRGIGKSKLVDSVIAELARDIPHLRVCRHAAGRQARLDVRMLIGDLEGRPGEPAELRQGEPLLGRLVAALDATEQSRIVIVIESAENLTRSGDERHVDLQLDEALHEIAESRRHRVSVVLVSQVTLESRVQGVWSSAEAPIGLGALPYDEFVQFLGTLDDKHVLGVAGLPDVSRRMLHRVLQGNPRSAEFLKAIIMLTERGFDIDRLVEAVAVMDPRRAPQQLADLLVDGLSTPRRHVLQAVAAYASPVGIEAVTALTAGAGIEADVAGILNVLVESQVVSVAPGKRYYVPPSDVDRLLPRGVERLELLGRAADELGERRHRSPNKLDDLDIHFVQLGLLVRACEYPVAYDVIEDIHHYLNRWNCGFLLTEYREQVRGMLGDPFLEMANDNELGDLYGESGSFLEADAAYGRALDYANQFGNPEIRTKLRANLGGMYWQRNDAQNAYNYYQMAREEAANGDLVVLMGALEGLADCHRRWGQYEAALDRAGEALAVPSRPGYAEGVGLGTAGSVRMVSIALRRARWYNELSRTAEAAASLDAAERIEVSRDDPWLRAACLDGRADLLLTQNALPEAIARATDAMEQATLLHDSVIILQARTTLCMAALIQGDMRKAAEHIENADRYRRPERALIVLAMRALVTLQTDATKAAELFDELARQARTRIGKDARDFGAYDMLGFAICGQLLETDESLADAIGAFQAARDITESTTPGLLTRRLLLLRQLDQSGRRPGRLGPVLDALSSTGSSPTG